MTTPQDPENRPQQEPYATPAPPPPQTDQPAGYQSSGHQPSGYQPAGYQPSGNQPAGYQAAGYEAYPSGANEPAKRGPGAAPKQVRISFWLWLATAALMTILSIAALAIMLANPQALVDIAKQSAGGDQGLTDEQLRTGLVAFQVFFTVAAVVVAGLLVFFAVKARAGRPWARTWLNVTGIVALLLSMFGFTLLSLLVVLPLVAAVFLLYTPASKEYFEAAKRLR
ncbi:hypothetical protein [Saccharothrix xinjiangensis]|uniref:DUF4064 domain-containing protein n=1 Tax=Saccharothrix xinjiangensis TaxID=204798 RepID=A0ABV9Y5K2_9PSEU